MKIYRDDICSLVTNTSTLVRPLTVAQCHKVFAFCVMQKYVSERVAYVGSGECLAHWCYNPDVERTTCELRKDNPVLAGTWCGVGKWCAEGECTENNTLERGPHRPRCNCKFMSFLWCNITALSY